MRRDSSVQRVAGDQFYWLELDRPLAGLHELVTRHADELEQQLPVSIDRLQFACAATGEDGVVICAIEHEVLREQVEADATMLIPTSVPEFVSDHGSVLTGNLNLLHGAHEPRVVRRRRRLRQASRVFTFVGLVVALLIGFEMRVVRFRGQARQLDSEVTHALQSLSAAVPRGASAVVSGVDDAIAQVLRLQRALRDPSVVVPVSSCHSLQEFLASWPDERDLQLSRLRAEPDCVTAEVIGGADAIEHLRDELMRSGWSVRLLRSQRPDGVTRVVVERSTRAGSERIG